ncbi:MAG: hypothetical protein LBS01_10445, partial [Prevotellaceae bacterium]|nr:hypothetical protein [Prevotellaceae bacterium]
GMGDVSHSPPSLWDGGGRTKNKKIRAKRNYNFRNRRHIRSKSAPYDYLINKKHINTITVI